MVTHTLRNPWSYYGLSLAATAVAVVLGYFVGGFAGAFDVLVLSVLETSLSLDNAVVNAKVLQNWPDPWVRAFRNYGIWIAVFFMRLVFPLAIVSVATGVSMLGVTDLALHHPDQYAAHLSAAHYQISGFGGAFLLLVALGFFFSDRELYWLGWAERKLAGFGQIEGISVAVTLGALMLAMHFVPAANKAEFFMAGVVGIIGFVVAHGLGTLLGGEDDDPEEATGVTAAAAGAAGTIVKAGVAGFLYLEILDASFSFDGVLGAFAITTYLPLIMLGLGAGAFFVRSFTMHLVDAGTLSEYRYLEHGAFYAILVLAVIQLSPTVHLPEWVVGLSGAVILAAALLHSVAANRAELTGAPATA